MVVAGLATRPGRRTPKIKQSANGETGVLIAPLQQLLNARRVITIIYPTGLNVVWDINGNIYYIQA